MSTYSAGECTWESALSQSSHAHAIEPCSSVSCPRSCEIISNLLFLFNTLMPASWFCLSSALYCRMAWSPSCPVLGPAFTKHLLKSQ